jgi:hypothetical protein
MTDARSAEAYGLIRMSYIRFGRRKTGLKLTLRLKEPVFLLKKLHTITYEHQTKIKIDVCPKCDGIFLDAGELEEIHKATETWIEKLKEKADEDLIALELFMSKVAPLLPR